jgi:DNA-binding winged helix-turn-helix (wHTH) protein
MNFERPRFGVQDGLLAVPSDLAHLKPFHLGKVQVVPAMRRIDSQGDTSVVVEPLVMQVLVSLARASGNTLTRDDLVAECWGRKIVGDDAVNRVISRLRRSLAKIASDDLSIETIAKVGYRLHVANGSREIASSDAQGMDAPMRYRRRVPVWPVALAATSAVAGIGIVAFRQQPTPAIAIAIEPINGIGSDVASAQLAANLTSEVARLTGSMTQLTLVERRASTEADMKLEVSYPGPASDEEARVRLSVMVEGF